MTLRPDPRSRIDDTTCRDDVHPRAHVRRGHWAERCTTAAAGSPRVCILRKPPRDFSRAVLSPMPTTAAGYCAASRPRSGRRAGQWKAQRTVGVGRVVYEDNGLPLASRQGCIRNDARVTACSYDQERAHRRVPVNFGAVAWPSRLMPSAAATRRHVRHRIFRSSASEQCRRTTRRAQASRSNRARFSRSLAPSP